MHSYINRDSTLNMSKTLRRKISRAFVNKRSAAQGGKKFNWGLQTKLRSGCNWRKIIRDYELDGRPDISLLKWAAIAELQLGDIVLLLPPDRVSVPCELACNFIRYEGNI